MSKRVPITRRVRINREPKPLGYKGRSYANVRDARDIEDGVDTSEADGIDAGEKPTRRAVDVKGRTRTVPISFNGGILQARNGGGRPAGVENKVPRSIKDAVRQAMQLHGSDGKGKDEMVGYMLDLATNHKHLFVSLVRRILPLQLKAEVEPGSLMSRLLQTAQAQRQVQANANTIDVTPTPSWRRRDAA
jgi:hypothetical protein